MKTILDNTAIKVSIVERNSDQAVLCFMGVGHAMGGLDVQSEEFYKISKNATTIFITDKERSWGNNLNFEELKRITAPYIKDRTIYALGNSMGGFLAILASRYFKFSSVVSFVPQFSVSKKIIPSENRWDKYVNRIDNWRFESLQGAFSKKTKYYILSGVNKKELKHLELFPTQDNVNMIIFNDPKFSHRVAKVLKTQGVLYEVIRDCFSLKSSNELIKTWFEIESRTAFQSL